MDLDPGNKKVDTTEHSQEQYFSLIPAEYVFTKLVTSFSL